MSKGKKQVLSLAGGLLALLLAGNAWICFRFLFPICFLPCTGTLLASVLVERAFQKHMGGGLHET